MPAPLKPTLGGGGRRGGGGGRGGRGNFSKIERRHCEPGRQEVSEPPSAVPPPSTALPLFFTSEKTHWGRGWGGGG